MATEAAATSSAATPGTIRARRYGLTASLVRSRDRSCLPRSAGRICINVLHPTIHHFLVAGFAPADDFRGVRVPPVIGRVIEMRRDDEAAPSLDRYRVLETVNLLPLKAVMGDE